MKDLEFYIFEDELWCLFPDGSNQPVTDKDIGLIKVYWIVYANVTQMHIRR